MFVNSEEFKKWKDGDTSIPLAEVLDSFEIFHSGQGNQGKLGRASKQTLDTIFGTTKEDEAALIVLQKGTLHGEGSVASKYGDSNSARGGAFIDTRGSGSSLRGV